MPGARAGIVQEPLPVPPPSSQEWCVASPIHIPLGSSARPRVLILGGGFGGLHAARGLAGAPASITLVDRQNHHTFQPLLYQVATAMLSPANIAAPIRHILRRQSNARVVLGDASRIDPDARVVHLADGAALAYDILVVATGATHSYFGHDQWAAHAPGLKTIDDALAIRRRYLLAFEAAERATDETSRRAALTFVVIGAGPTGVELAGAMSEIARSAFHKDFRSIDTSTARVLLIEAQDRVLPTYPHQASARALDGLRSLGVEVMLETRAVEVDGSGITVVGARVPDPQRIDAGNIIWAAGVRASPLAASLGAPLDPAGRVIVEPDLSVPGRPEVLVVGDLARVEDPRTGQLVPGVAPAAMQMGDHAARVIRDRLLRPGAPLRPFRYKDKGTLATIGRNRAVAYMFGRVFSGFFAWAFWALLHVYFLIGFRNRVLTMLEWMWAYFTFSRGARLITGTTDRERA